MNGITKIVTSAALGLLLSAAPGLSQQIVMGTGQQGSQNYGVNTGIAAVLSDNGFNISLESYGGSGSVLPLLNAGDIDVWAGGAPDLTAATEGSEYFGGMKLEDVRIVARLFGTPIGFFVKRDSGMETPADIKGKTIAWGFTSQPTLQSDVGAMLANLGLSIDDMKSVLVPSVGAGGDEFMTGNIDVGFFAIRAGKMKEIDASVGGVRFLDMDPSDAAVARMKEVVRSSDIMQVKGGEGTTGVAEDLDVYAFNQVLAVRADLPDEIVEKLIMALHDNPDAVRASKINADFDPTDMARDVTGLPWHPAAIATFQKLGLK
ncbi:NMT1-like family protein (plasmid) [Antarctobacter heliothermus]|uniref:NMT1-like family protein n=1 Tax=Antarctobacter heliothermus TaxID=74033 RepID=A0A222EC11_9RHOB|nr:TAXI family TRAP transporter solute-binding subunit [Antarctobacter heliothermus]ASP23682.1 NMT1-like family protein [Antarctobacter heliothermus]